MHLAASFVLNNSLRSYMHSTRKQPRDVQVRYQFIQFLWFEYDKIFGYKVAFYRAKIEIFETTDRH